MPSIQIYLEEKEDKKVWELSNLWDLSKHDTIKKIIRNFILKKEKENDTKT